MLVPQYHLEYMRGMSKSNMPERVIFQRQSITRIAGGVDVKGDWYNLHTKAEPCRMVTVVKAFRMVEIEMRADQLEEYSYWIVATSHVFDPGFKPGDRALVTSLKEGWTKTLEILGTTGPRSNEAVRQWVCRSFKE